MTTVAPPAALESTPLSRWSRTMNEWCGAFVVRGNPASFEHGELAARTYGRARVAVVRADPHSADYVPTHRTGLIHLYMALSGVLTLRGSSQQLELHPGDLAAIDLNQPYRLRLDRRGEFIAVCVPYLLVGLSPQCVATMTGTVWPSDQGLAPLVGGTLRAIAQYLSSPHGVVADSMGLTIGGLLTALFAERAQLLPDVACSERQIQFMRILQFIRDNLQDPGLGAPTVARKFSLSLRYLQQLFAENNTSPAKLIREERLQRCYNDLLNPALDRNTLAAIGAKWGFRESSHFTRRFRERFNCLPSEVRMARSQASA